MTLQRPTDSILRQASDLLQKGSLVAFPTETVYGLGGDASQDKAVAHIFEMKKRPHFNPLIIHVHSLQSAETLAYFSEKSLKLARYFWPGPLTLILRRREKAALSHLATAGLDTVAIRIPSHPIALKLLSLCSLPIAAPSANLSGQVSPTRADHVLQSLSPSLILDGGACSIGLESTVLDLSQDKPFILRPGFITAQKIQDYLCEPIFYPKESEDKPLLSPGMLSSHYAPSRPVRLNVTKPYDNEAFLGFGAVEKSHRNLSEKGDLIEAAANLFAMLRDLDTESYAGIAVSPIPMNGLGRAINDRLKRASTPK